MESSTTTSSSSASSTGNQDIQQPYNDPRDADKKRELSQWFLDNIDGITSTCSGIYASELTSLGIGSVSRLRKKLDSQPDFLHNVDCFEKFDIPDILKVISKSTAEDRLQGESDEGLAPAKKKRGRPLGSLNKVKKEPKKIAREALSVMPPSTVPIMGAAFSLSRGPGTQRQKSGKDAKHMLSGVKFGSIDQSSWKGDALSRSVGSHLMMVEGRPHIHGVDSHGRPITMMPRPPPHVSGLSTPVLLYHPSPSGGSLSQPTAPAPPSQGLGGGYMMPQSVIPARAAQVGHVPLYQKRGSSTAIQTEAHISTYGNFPAYSFSRGYPSPHQLSYASPTTAAQPQRPVFYSVPFGHAPISMMQSSPSSSSASAGSFDWLPRPLNSVHSLSQLRPSPMNAVEMVSGLSAQSSHSTSHEGLAWRTSSTKSTRQIPGLVQQSHSVDSPSKQPPTDPAKAASRNPRYSETLLTAYCRQVCVAAPAAATTDAAAETLSVAPVDADALSVAPVDADALSVAPVDADALSVTAADADTLSAGAYVVSMHQATVSEGICVEQLNFDIR